jgi:hypothetical protein
MFNNNDDDEDIPAFDPSKANRKTLREMLIKMHEDENEKMKIPLYSEGYEHGFKIGALGAKTDAKETILGILRIFDNKY